MQMSSDQTAGWGVKKGGDHTILRTRGAMEIYQNPKSVLPCPLEGTEDILPGRASHEGFAIPHVNSPPGDRNSDPIQSSACDLRKVLFGLNGEYG